MVSFRYRAPPLVALLVAVGFSRAQEPYERWQDGYRVLGLENPYWKVEAVPELGGKVVSLQDRLTRREWLWSRDAERSLHAPDDARGFGAGNLIGADELLPTLAATVWQGRELPQHGELWLRPASLDAGAWTEGIIRTEVALVSLPLHYRRELSLEGRRVRMDFRLENTGDEPVPYLWAWHPLLTIVSGDRLSPAWEEDSLRVTTAPGLPQLTAGETITWPGTDAGVDLSQLDLGDVPKAGIKLFGRSTVGSLSLVNDETGTALSVSYQAEILPFLAIWLSRGVWGAAHHLAVEPTNRPDESLSRVSPAEEPAGWLLPGEIRQWRLMLENRSQPSTP